MITDAISFDTNVIIDFCYKRDDSKHKTASNIFIKRKMNTSFFYTKTVKAEWKRNRSRFRKNLSKLRKSNKINPFAINTLIFKFEQRVQFINENLKTIASYSRRKQFNNIKNDVFYCIPDEALGNRENDAEIITESAYWGEKAPFEEKYLISFDGHFNSTPIRECLKKYFGSLPIKIKHPSAVVSP